MDAVDSTEVVKVDPVAPPPMTRGEKWKRRGPLLPALVFTLLLTQIPFLLTLIFSFQRWRLLDGGEATFNGGKNYVDIRVW